MSDLDLTPIKGRLARARHLPVFLTVGDIAKARENRKVLYRWHLEGTWDDAVLFGRASDDIAALVAEVERLRARLDAVKEIGSEHWNAQIKRESKFGRTGSSCVCEVCNIMRALEGGEQG